MSDDPESATGYKPKWPPQPRRRPVGSPSGPVQIPTSAPPPIPIQHIETNPKNRLGILDSTKWSTWEMSLSKKELDQWRKVKEIFEGASQDFISATLNLLVEKNLERANNGRSDADLACERFRRDLIDRNILAYAGQVDQIDVALMALVTGVEALDQQTESVAALGRDVDHAISALQVQGIQLEKVSGQWERQWPGAERGRGISGYDQPAGIAHVKAEVEAAVQRRLHQQKTAKAEAEKPSIRAEKDRTGKLF